ncbi:DUF1570 domain-containing protein [Sphingomonas sp. LB-2]|uniref:DUF1570 domain-containing protein n=1 Tax=Sphingomonas caeni TaxID=2984949 RepID=UPI00222E6553|nr:DUF1570 domain-containing protein [Sphingomonas caeni]MCW3849470.1 DUF1570 domain-containing protein [Sphingomonas caeni]
MIRKLLFALLLLVLPGVAHAEWYEVGTEHFVVISNDQPERMQRFATNLERFDKALRLYGDVQDLPVGKANRVVVYVLDDVAAVQKLAKNPNLAGYYLPRAEGSLAFVPRSTGADQNDFTPMVILLHEYTHHFMFNSFPNAAFPLWYSEGFAELFSTAVFDKTGVIFGYPPQHRGYGLMSGNALPVDKLLTAESLKLNDSQREAVYGRGWLLTHYLYFGGKRPGQLVNYLLAINSGKTPLEAAQVFGDLRALDRELEHYKLGNFAGYRVPADKISIGEVTVRKLTPGEAATIAVRMQSKNGVTKETAPAVYAAAKKACAPFPNDPGAQLVLAEAAYDADDFAGAEAAADRALAADPNRVDALLYKARAKMAVAAKADDFKPETWRGIRAIIASANKLDPEDPEPLILFYQSYLEGHQRPTKNAITGLLYAYELAPQDRSLRLNVAAVYLNDGDPVMARRLLLPLAYDPHNPGLAAVAAKMIADIDARPKGEPKPAATGTTD